MFSRFFAITLRTATFNTTRCSRLARHRNSRPQFRPIVELLETRDLLTAGDLDLSFGSGGVVVNDLSPSTDGAIDVIFQADGKIVAGGYNTNSQGERDSVLRRYNTNGSLDTSFGTNGMTVTDFKGGWNDQGLALAAQPDGKIIGVASSYNPNDFTFPFDARWGVARYTANGALDKSFGTQGKVVTDLSKGTDIVTGVALQADGKIVVSGSTNGFAGGDNFFVARYNANGSTDTTFGAGKGYVITDFGGSDGSSELTIQGDGKIVVVGHAYGGSLGDLNQFAIARYNTNGSLDSTFGSGGKVLTAFNDEAIDVLVQADGRIVVSGGTFVARYLSLNGSLDTSFGGGAGYVTAGGHSLTAQADGKLVLGNNESFYEDLGDGSNIQSSRFVLTRISGVDGSVDSSFGTSGRITTYLTEPGKRGANNLNAVAVQADGRIVGAAQTGVYDAAGKLNAKFTLVRYLGDAPPAAASLAAPSSADAALLLFMDDAAAAKRRGG